MKLLMVMTSLLFISLTVGAQQVDLLKELDKQPDPVSQVSLESSSCKALYFDADRVIAAYKNLKPSLKTIANLKRIVDFQVALSNYINSQTGENKDCSIPAK